jgi:membrane associated rhomboid family serine protease
VNKNFTFERQHPIMEEQDNLRGSILITVTLVSVLWIVQFIQMIFGFDWSSYGVNPHELIGLRGIIFAPFLHDPYHLTHIASNSLAILILLTVLLNAYPKIALVVLLIIHVLSGALVWALAPEGPPHIGISGIIYGIAAFLVGSGIFRKDRTSIAISIFVVMMYGGMVLGFLPQEGISWQSHLFGAIVGFLLSYLFKEKDKRTLTETELEIHEIEKHFFEENE